MAIRAVAFDLDYTLAVPKRDRETLLTEATEAVSGAPDLSREAYLQAHREHLTAETREPLFASLLEGHGDDADPAELTAAYRDRVTRALVPIEGAEELFATLRERYRLGLLTNGPVLAQRSKLRWLGWEDAFDAALITGELPAGKPDGSAFEALLSALGTDPGETVFVGDHVREDIEGAAETGLIPIQVVYDGGPDPSPRARVHVDRDGLADRLPGILAELSELT